MSEEFPVDTGLGQGDALSPILFNIALESVVRKVPKYYIDLKIGEQNMVIATYADDLIITGKTEDRVRNTAKKLIEEGKSIGLNIDEDKTKYLIVSRRQHHQNEISVEDMTFEKVSNFKYLGVDVNESANSHEENDRRIIAVNKLYFTTVQDTITFKENKNKAIQNPGHTYYITCVWGIGVNEGRREEARYNGFERKILRRIFGLKKNTENN